jgi:hypothetical protein
MARQTITILRGGVGIGIKKTAEEADPDANTDTGVEIPLARIAEASGFNGSPERHSLSGSHGHRPWFWRQKTCLSPDFL